MFFKHIALIPLILGPIICGSATAQGYPTRPVKLVIPYTAGGSASIIGRTLAQRLSLQMPYPVIVENRGGAAAQVGTEYVSRSTPDGYTILQGNMGPITIAPAMFPKLPFDPVKELAPITLLGAVDSVVAVTASLPVTTIAELVAYSKAHPASVNFTSTGVCQIGSGHFGELSGRPG